VEERVADVTDASSLRGIADGCDAVIHAASRPGFAALDHERQRRVIVAGTKAVLDEAASAGSRCFVLLGYTGTVQERGDGSLVDEETPPSAQYESPFVRMMMEAEVAVLEANLPGAIRTMVVSPGVLLAAGRNTLLTGLASLYLRRELPYLLLEDAWLAISGAKDVAATVLRAVERGRGGRRYFAFGECVRLGAFYEILRERSGVPPPRRRLPDLLAEELGLLAPLLPEHSFLRTLLLPRELLLHLRRLAPARSDGTRESLGLVAEPLRALVDEVVRAENPLAGGGGG
jgi:dihydroflavonol-4-reductase